MNWPSSDRLKSSLSHIVTGLVPFVIGSLLFWNLWVGAFAVICVFWSREKCQHQYKLKGNKPTYTVWNKGWSPLEWEFASQLDLYIPALFYTLVALIF
jgi:hypothetical protein